MRKQFLIVWLLLAFSLWQAMPALAQQKNTSPLSGPIQALLQVAASPTQQAYVQAISSSPQNSWNAGANTFASAPQSIGGIIPNGVGQVQLPGIGKVTPTGSYQQELVIPTGVPVLGGAHTGITTQVNTYVDSQGRRIEAAVDPLSAFNYALSHGDYDARQATGASLPANALGNWLAGHSGGDTSTEAFRIDPGLVIGLNSSYGQGWGNLFGVGVYVYPAVTAAASGFDGSDSVPASPENAPSQPPSPDGPPILPMPNTPPNPIPPKHVPPYVPGPNEEVYLKAVIPQPEPDFVLAFQPPYPTVVGQDPTRRGVDVTGTATLYPCTVIWHHVLREYYTFCGKATCNCSVDDCGVRESIKEWDTTELEPDALASANVDSALSAKAAEAITSGQLAQLYPGTQIYQGGVRAFPSEWARVTANNVGTPSNWQFQAERIPYADPGAWDYSVRLATTGTPHCAPLNWSKNFPGILTLWLREQRLVK